MSTEAWKPSDPAIDQPERGAKWFEEYGCGCTSKGVRLRRELLGYCSTHGDSRRNLYKESGQTVIHVKRKAP